MKKIFLILAMLWGVCYAQITLNSDIVTASQRSVDGKQYKLVAGKHVPYSSASEVLSIIPLTRRHVGQIFYVGNDVYHFVNNIADSSLKIREDTISLGGTLEYVNGVLQAKIQTGTAPPTTTPSALSLIYIDTVNKNAYIAVGTSSSADWKLITLTSPN